MGLYGSKETATIVEPEAPLVPLKLFIENPDVDRSIFSHLLLKQLLIACQVNKYAVKICDPVFWRNYAEKLGWVLVPKGSPHSHDYKRDLLALIGDPRRKYRGRNGKIHCLIISDCAISIEWSLKGSASQAYYSITDQLFSSGVIGNEAKTDAVYKIIAIAISQGHLDYIKKLSMNYSITLNYIPYLFVACRHGQLEIVKYLLTDASLAPNDHMSYSTSPLHEAAQNGHLEIAKILEDSGADIKYDNFEAVRIALQNNHVEVATFLLDVYNNKAVV